MKTKTITIYLWAYVLVIMFFFVFIIVITKQFVLKFSNRVYFLAYVSVLTAYFSKAMKYPKPEGITAYCYHSLKLNEIKVTGRLVGWLVGWLVMFYLMPLFVNTYRF